MTKLTDAIRTLRDTTVPRHEAEHGFYLAIADALEELDRRTGLGQQVLHVGEWLPDGFRLRVGTAEAEPEESGICSGCDTPLDRCGPKLWAQQKKCCPDCSHSVPPSREGEALPDQGAAERLGIDTKAWAAEVRQKVETALRSAPAESGEAPDPLPEVLPVGTRSLGGEIFVGEARLEMGFYSGRARWAAEADGWHVAHVSSLCIDWADYRRTHSPPPSREGEARFVPSRECLTCSRGATHPNPGTPDDDTEQLCHVCYSYAADIRALRQRAEAAEARAAEWEARTDDAEGRIEERAAALYQLHRREAVERLEAELEAAEARAGLAEQREKEARATAEQWRHEANDNADAIERVRQEREALRRELEAARARVTAAERLAGERKQELSYAHQEKLGLEEELDAARARVGELEAVMGRVSDNLNCIAYGTNYDDKGVPWCRDQLQAALREPTPSAVAKAATDGAENGIGQAVVAPTPAAVDDVLPAPNPPAVPPSGAFAGFRIYRVGEEEESPPRDSGGETTGAEASARKDEGRGDASGAATAEPVAALPTSSLVGFSARCPGCGAETILTMATALPGMPTCPMCGRPTKGPHEQCKDPSETAKAATHVVSSPASVARSGTGSPGAVGVLQPGSAVEVAPPGLTPEEAEDGARRMYEEFCAGGEFSVAPDWAREPCHDSWIDAYRFAHSEGAKAKGGKVAERVRATRKWVTGQSFIGQSVREGDATMRLLLTELEAIEALAAELEGAK